MEKSTRLDENNSIIDDFSIQEIEQIRSRVSVIGENIIYMKTLPFPTLPAGKLMWDREKELSKSWSSYYVIIDSTESKSRATGEYRRYIQKLLESRENIKYIVFVAHYNVFFRQIIKFLMRRTLSGKYTIKTTVEEALEFIEEFKEKSA